MTEQEKIERIEQLIRECKEEIELKNKMFSNDKYLKMVHEEDIVILHDTLTSLEEEKKNASK